MCVARILLILTSNFFPPWMRPDATPFLRVAYIYRPQTKLREGNVSTGVCLSNKGEGGYSTPPAPTDAWDMGLRDTVDKRSVRIVLECFLFLTLDDPLDETWVF